MKHNAAYDAQYEELKGDVFNARGEIAQARIAYDKAINLQGIAASQWLKLKRQNLGQNLEQGSAKNLSAAEILATDVLMDSVNL